MEDVTVLLCKRGDKSVAIILSQNLNFESLVSKLSHKWKDLTQGCFEISYMIDGHPNCDVDCDEDLIALRTLANKFRIGRIDVFVHDLTGSNTSMNVGECADRSSTSMNEQGFGELISEIDNGSEMTLPLAEQERKQLKSDAWRIAIKGVGQVFVGGAAAFRDSLSKYSLVHGFQYIYAKNDSETVKACCRTLHCTWFVKAKVEKPNGLFRIKEFMNEHSCGATSLSTKSSRSSSSLIGRIFSEAIWSSPSKRPVDVRKELKRDYGVDVTCRGAWMGVEKARSLYPICVAVVDSENSEKLALVYVEELAAKWKSVICPKWDKKLVELFGLSKTWTVVSANGDLYEVQSNPSVSVDIAHRSYSCGDWQLNMFPCVHGVCALKKSKKNLNDYMERCFFSESYHEAYSKCINPVARIWQNVDLDAADDTLLPPLCKRPPGRPRTERIPSTGAKTRKVTCSRCGQVGTHNRGTCKEPLES
ncbi:hypothetical protein RHMOL_Rhmol13G0132000 [Rhododendron molle]|uniref:Uncharacterized protein n=1 Tax=Rhododendron molle TaxID=49168 RepID=A0ACC0L6Q7_RHOML|nr:hypothetical protein RHMOL_Rhmol13G0132000 [Rhododendron molle]